MFYLMSRALASLTEILSDFKKIVLDIVTTQFFSWHKNVFFSCFSKKKMRQGKEMFYIYK